MAQDTRSRPALYSALLTVALFIIAPSQGHTDELATQSDRSLSDELQLLKEEETIGIETRDRQPISALPSEPYIMTDEDIRESGARDLPTLLRGILGLDVPQGTEPETNGNVRVDSRLMANRLLIVLDGRSINIDTSHAVPWEDIPATLPDIKRIEVWNESASAIRGFNGYDAVINITTKTSRN